MEKIYTKVHNIQRGVVLTTHSHLALRLKKK